MSYRVKFKCSPNGGTLLLILKRIYLWLKSKVFRIFLINSTHISKCFLEPQELLHFNIRYGIVTNPYLYFDYSLMQNVLTTTYGQTGGKTDKKMSNVAWSMKNKFLEHEKHNRKIAMVS